MLIKVDLLFWGSMGPYNSSAAHSRAWCGEGCADCILSLLLYFESPNQGPSAFNISSWVLGMSQRLGEDLVTSLFQDPNYECMWQSGLQWAPSQLWDEERRLNASFQLPKLYTHRERWMWAHTVSETEMLAPGAEERPSIVYAWMPFACWFLCKMHVYHVLLWSGCVHSRSKFICWNPDPQMIVMGDGDFGVMNGQWQRSSPG